MRLPPYPPPKSIPCVTREWADFKKGIPSIKIRKQLIRKSFPILIPYKPKGANKEK